MKICDKKHQKGSALVYILIAIALLAALTATFMDSSSQQTSSQNAFNAVNELSSQINFIRSAIQECVLVYPGGDSAMPANPVGGQNVVRPYPLMPYNSYLTTPTAGTSLVKDIRCPGNPGNSSNHAKVFGGTSGKFLPPQNSLFVEWIYYNDADGVFILTKTDKTDAYLDSALQRLDAQFSPCEAQYINNTTSSNIAVASTGAACHAKHKCFVVRLITTPSAIYPGEPAGTCP